MGNTAVISGSVAVADGEGETVVPVGVNMSVPVSGLSVTSGGPDDAGL